MRRYLLREWIRAARETKGAVTWSEYLSYPIKHRYLLHYELTALIEEMEDSYAVEKQKAGI